MSDPRRDVELACFDTGKLFTHEFIMWVLWERTAYPFSSWDETMRQFREYVSDPAEGERKFDAAQQALASS